MSEQPACIEFDDLSGSVTVNGVSYNLRPKTYELLKLLASAPGRVFSKADILTAVWPDTVVEEQAIFQCVNEVRKTFGATEAIKTYPRKGYAWVLAATPTAAAVTGAMASQRQPLWFASVAAVLVLALVAWLSLNHKPAAPTTKMQSGKTLLVLPVNVQQLDSSQHWLRFGAMDALIQQLQADSQLTVYQLTDVLAILQRLPEAAEPDISALFAVSGVSEIVQLELTGVPGDYHLLYTLYRPDSRNKGLLHSNRIEQGLPLLAQQLSTALAGHSAATMPGFDQQFQNDLLATALTFLAADELDSARSFIESALVNEPDHVFALYLLAGIHLQQQQPQNTLTLTKRALRLIGASTSPNASPYHARLLFLQGTARLQLGELTAAAPLLTEAAALTYRAQDWLYYAYSQAMAGNSALLQRDFATAYPLLSTALQYQQLLACPQGIAQSQLDLASYFLLTEQPEQAQQYLQQSKQLAARQGLVKLLPDIAHLELALQQQPL